MAPSHKPAFLHTHLLFEVLPIIKAFNISGLASYRTSWGPQPLAFPQASKAGNLSNAGPEFSWFDKKLY